MNRRTNTLLIAIFYLFASAGVWAQTSPPPDPILQQFSATFQQVSPNGNGNFTSLDQVGNTNESLIIQEQTGSTFRNIAQVLQSGDLNMAAIRHTGADNLSQLIQLGNLNQLQLMVQGSGNEFLFLQQGDANRILQTIASSNNSRFELFQIGNSNEIIYIRDNISNSSFRLVQRGNALKVNITQTGF